MYRFKMHRRGTALRHPQKGRNRGFVSQMYREPCQKADYRACFPSHSQKERDRKRRENFSVLHKKIRQKTQAVLRFLRLFSG